MAGRTGRDSKKKKTTPKKKPLSKGMQKVAKRVRQLSSGNYPTKSNRTGSTSAKPYAANLAQKAKPPKRTYKTDGAPKTRKNPPAPSGHQSKRTKGFKPAKPKPKRWTARIPNSALDSGASVPKEVKDRQNKAARKVARKTKVVNTGKALRSKALSFARRPTPAGLVTAAALTAASFIPPQKRQANPVSKINRQRSYANMWSASEISRRVNKGTTTKPKPVATTKPKPAKVVSKKSNPTPLKTRTASSAKGYVKTKGGDYPIYKKKSASAKSFRETFRLNRKAGKKTFKWRGRMYTTQLKKKKK